ncbi:hypothetical protein [Nocardioides flavescens]|uniref:Uncharacterized protein n=1 Tax=Nocardioides flavescens TaxID=2691959 RepID=A0A6L7F3M2_9ACTN|nr:hypothetical protein [Nocardioides flavescens]MXG91816.1 hypothetical protein [Nocardioides flavescens]
MSHPTTRLLMRARVVTAGLVVAAGGGTGALALSAAHAASTEADGTTGSSTTSSTSTSSDTSSTTGSTSASQSQQPVAGSHSS